MTRAERNKQVVRDYVAAFNADDFEALGSLFAEDARVQGVLHAGGVESVMPIWRQLHEGLAMELEIDEMVCEGDTVAVRYTERGTFRAPFFGHEPTGRSYELVAMEFFTLRDGEIVARWGARDQASQARQLGYPLD